MKQITCLLFCLYFLNSSAQTFDFSITSDTVYCNYQNETDHCYSYIINESSELLEIDIIRQAQFTAPDWASAMCADTVCYYASVDSIRVNVPAQSNIEFRPGFILLNDTTNQVAKVTYLIIDSNDPGSQLFYDTYAINTNAVTNTFDVNRNSQVLVYPNPVSDKIFIESELIIESIELINTEGRILGQWNSVNNLNLIHLQKGVFYLKIKTNSGWVLKQIIKL